MTKASTQHPCMNVEFAARKVATNGMKIAYFKIAYSMTGVL